jgi:sortase (surface protein transpeptidase)
VAVAGRQVRRHRRALAATGSTVALVLAGVTCIGIALWPSVPVSPALLTAAQEAAGPPVPDRPLPRAPGASTSAERAATGLLLPVSTPVSVTIPAIGVVSPLLHLGQAADGTMEVPPPGPQYDQAGWYRHSPAPGQLGPAVLAGHVDSAADGPSVFFRLAELEPGDEVLVERADGVTAVFRVDEVGRFAKADFPTTLVYGDVDHAALRLITCGGSFDRASGHYLDNVVVTATLTGSRGTGRRN